MSDGGNNLGAKKQELPFILDLTTSGKARWENPDPNESLEWDILLPEEQPCPATYLTDQTEADPDFGKQLWEALFPSGKQHENASRAEAAFRTGSSPLFLRMREKSNEAGYMWELLAAKSGQNDSGRIAITKGVVRLVATNAEREGYLPGTDRENDDVQPEKSLKVLFMASSPLQGPAPTTVRLDLRKYAERFENNIDGLPIDGEIYAPGRVEDLQSYTKKNQEARVHLVHIVAHGTSGCLVLEGNGGVQDMVNLEPLVDYLPPESVLLLESCNTASPGNDGSSLAAQIAAIGRARAVIGMQAPLAISAGDAFAREFYESVAKGTSLCEAIIKARSSIETKARSRQDVSPWHWAVPVLYVNREEDAMRPLFTRSGAIQSGSIKNHTRSPTPVEGLAPPEEIPLPFWGYDDELVSLHDFLNESSRKITNICGPPRSGRKSLAAFAVRRLCHGFTHVAWLDQPEHGEATRLLKLEARSRYLFVIGDLDKVGVETLRWIRNILSTDGSDHRCVVITDDQEQIGDAAKLLLTGLRREAAIELVKHWSNERQPRLSDQRIDEIVNGKLPGELRAAFDRSDRQSTIVAEDQKQIEGAANDEIANEQWPDQEQTDGAADAAVAGGNLPGGQGAEAQTEAGQATSHRNGRRVRPRGCGCTGARDHLGQACPRSRGKRRTTERWRRRSDRCDAAGWRCRAVEDHLGRMAGDRNLRTRPRICLGADSASPRNGFRRSGRWTRNTAGGSRRRCPAASMGATPSAGRTWTARSRARPNPAATWSSSST
ncbi:MAG: CHAT domain-containing protein [Minicystis sp.]